VWCGSCAAGGVESRSNFVIAFTYSDVKQTDTVVAGVYRDRISLTPSGARFLSRMAVIDGSVMPRYVTYPL
jgi:hypothetical protein